MREYFNCPDCGKRTWKNTNGLFTERDHCVDCWKKFLAAKGIHHCTECGAFAQSGSVLCKRCERIQCLETDLRDLRSEIYDVRTERTTCQTHNRELKSQVLDLDKKVKGFQKKHDYPFSLKVHEYDGACTKEYLEDVLKAAQIVPHVFKVEYERR